MIAKIRKWGNSMGVRIPKLFVDELRITLATEVDLRLRRGRLVMTPRRPARVSLGELLGRITKKNLHGEVDTGKSHGRELL